MKLLNRIWKATLNFLYRAVFIAAIIIGTVILALPEVVLLLLKKGSIICPYLDWMIDFDLRVGPILSPKSFGR